MPELPEVEVIKQGLCRLLPLHTIVKIAYSNLPLRLPMPKALLDTLVNGQTVTTVERRAKYIIIALANGAVLVFHLGMTGRLQLVAGETTPGRHDHLRLHLDNGMELRFHDPRRFGSVQVRESRQAMECELFARLGPEPFAPTFSAEYLLAKAARRSQPIKNFLMDNRVVVGIGNIYCNETLFAAGISPWQPAGTVGLSDWGKVVESARAVLSRAIACGGTTISDYVNSSGEPGLFQTELKVYGRAGAPCPICQGTILREKIAGRASYFCPSCQR